MSKMNMCCSRVNTDQHIESKEHLKLVNEHVQSSLGTIANINGVYQRHISRKPNAYPEWHQRIFGCQH